MKYCILFNPLAGNRSADPAPLMGKLTQSGFEVTTADLTAITDYAAFFAALDPADAVVLLGGDGTLNRFVNDTDGLEIPQTLLYSPGGTGNDFLRDIEKTPEETPLELAPYMQDLPYVEVQGKRYRFLNNVGFGIDGYCCEVGDAQRAANPGKTINYTGIAIKGLLFHYKPTTATVTVDGRTYTYKKAWLAPTMKGRYYGGGMNATPDQNRLDPTGKLSVMLFYGKGRLATLIAFPSIFEGKHIQKKKMVAIHEGYDIRVVFDAPRAVQIDGETITGVTEYRAYAASRAAEHTSAEAVVEA